MDRDVHVALLDLEVRGDLAFASLQSPQLIAHRAGVTVSPSNEIKAAFDATLDLLKFLKKVSARSMTFLPETSQFPLELSHELVDEALATKENVLQPVQHPLFQFVGTKADFAAAEAYYVASMQFGRFLGTA